VLRQRKKWLLCACKTEFCPPSPRHRCGYLEDDFNEMEFFEGEDLIYSTGINTGAERALSFLLNQ